MLKVLWKLFHIDVIILKFVCVNSFSRAFGVNKLAEIVQTFAAYKMLMSCPFPQRALAEMLLTNIYSELDTMFIFLYFLLKFLSTCLVFLFFLHFLFLFLLYIPFAFWGNCGQKKVVYFSVYLTGLIFLCVVFI